MGLGFPAGHVESYLAQNGLGHHHVDTVDSGQVYSSDALQLAIEIEAGCILGGFCLLSSRLGLRRCRRKVFAKLSQVFLQLPVTLGDALLVGVIHLHFLL